MFTVEGFRDFVRQHPADMPINHEHYAGCALGLFLQKLQADLIYHEDFIAAAQQLPSPLSDLHESTLTLNVNCFGWCEKHIPTYGDLLRLLESE